MPYDPETHHRRSIRLKGYDYAQAGAYFVTICTQNHALLFGDLIDGAMRLNAAGLMIRTVWDELPLFYAGVGTDAFIVMPNHIHGIIILALGTPLPESLPPALDDHPHAVRAAPRGRPAPDGRPVSDAHPAPLGPPDATGQAQGPAPTLSLPDVVHRFKTMTTKRYTDGVRHSGWPPFAGRLWQRSYYEHIVRDENDLSRIRLYMDDNPVRWESDREKADAAHPEPKEACRI